MRQPDRASTSKGPRKRGSSLVTRLSLLAAAALTGLATKGCGARSDLTEIEGATGTGGDIQPGSGGSDTTGCVDQDGDGHLPVACGGDDCDDTNPEVFPGAPDLAKGDVVWTIETLDTEGRSGYVSSIALDASQAPHVSYWSLPFFPNGPLSIRYATRTALGWSIETVDEMEGGFGYTALSLGPSGAPQIAYTDMDVVRHAQKEAGGWTTTPVSDPQWATQDISMATGPSGEAFVAYHGSNSLQFATNSGGDWSVVQLGDGFFTGLGARIARAPDGTLHVVYRGPGLYHASRPPQSESWSFETIEDSASYNALALDSAGIPHVAYVSPASPPELRLARLGPEGWTIETIASPGGKLGYVGLGIDANGADHVCYEEFGDGTGTLYYASDSSGQWAIEVVPGEPPYGSWCALAVSPNGTAHMTYIGGDYDLVFAMRAVPDGIDQDCDGEDG